MFKKGKRKKYMESEKQNGADNIAENEKNELIESDNSSTIQNEKNKNNPEETPSAPNESIEDEAQKTINNEWQDKFMEMHDKYLRLSAEFDNYRKRTLKEKLDLTKTAGESILKGLLPVMDDFERGMKHIDQSEEIEALKEGVKLIYLKFSEFLSQNGVKAIDEANNDFDTDIHEAITKIPVPGMSGKVVETIEKGYMLHEKVIRFSKVVVGE